MWLFSLFFVVLECGTKGNRAGKLFKINAPQTMLKNAYIIPSFFISIYFCS